MFTQLLTSLHNSHPSNLKPNYLSLTLNKLLTSSQGPLSVLTIRDNLQLLARYHDINSQGLLILPAWCVLIRMCFAVMRV